MDEKKPLDEMLVLLKYAGLVCRIALGYSRDNRNPNFAIHDIAMLGTIASAIGQDVSFYEGDLDKLTTAHQRVIDYHKNTNPELARALDQINKGWLAPFAEDWYDPEMDIYDEL